MHTTSHTRSQTFGGPRGHLRFETAIRRLAVVLRDHHSPTAEHSVRVADLTRAVALRLGLPPADIVEAELAALVHDVGKLAIPTELLDKPSSLTVAERDQLQAHSVRGEEILLKATSLDLGREVRACHERWDGTGYPDGLAGAGIPLVSRIIGACDALDAMLSERAYRAALSLDEAMRRLRAGAGTQFDPDVVAAVLVVAKDRFGGRPRHRAR